MKIAGIIAEYNPFHNGHKHHIEQVRKLTGADCLVIVMSGNFMQRGTPAVIDKYTRARMALENGADLVIELPLYCAAQSAEYFARGAVSLLNHMGIVDSICFGSECGDIRILTDIAKTLLNESDAFKATLKSGLKQGLAYPQARSIALEVTMPDYPRLADVLASPNNVLGIEYLKALITTNSSVKPFTNLRIGSGYHEMRLAGTHSSAIAIRQSLAYAQDMTLVRDQLPETVYHILTECYQKTFPVFTDDISSILRYRLLLDASSGYSRYIDVSPDLSDRILKHLDRYTTFTEFCDLLKTKDITHARISRCLLHILLDMTKEKLQRFVNADYAPYIKILGLNTNTPQLLGLLKEHADIPIISKSAHAKELLSPDAYAILEEDIFAAHIYQSIVSEKFNALFINEFRRQICKV